MTIPLSNLHSYLLDCASYPSLLNIHSSPRTRKKNMGFPANNPGSLASTSDQELITALRMFRSFAEDNPSEFASWISSHEWSGQMEFDLNDALTRCSQTGITATGID